MKKQKSRQPRSLRGLFRTEKSWIKGWLAKNQFNMPVNLDAPQAVKFCLMGGLYRVYGPDTTAYVRARARLTDVIKKRFHKRSIIAFNDAHRRTFKDIQRAIRLAKV